MTRNRPLPLTYTAEHRARQGAVQPVTARTTGATGVVRPPGAGLSARERRVKAILLKELKRTTQGVGLTYNERQKLEKTLGVAFIDAELDKMRKGIRWIPYIPIALFAPLAAAYLGAILGLISMSQSEPWLWGMLLIHGASAVGVPVSLHRALRRKIFIYEALRELSDADEADVFLDDTVRNADLLIDQIVDRELAADAWRPSLRYPRQN
ncbi:hypothetical protein BH23BAC4_BH23BAC4_13410 [soil metagenome]